MINADFHVHSNFSYDCEVEPKEQIESAIDKKLKYICFTDHYETDEMNFINNTQKYINKIGELKLIYKNKIKILVGVEIGLDTNFKDNIINYTNNYKFDFVIGSSHKIYGNDPAMGEYFNNKTEKQAYLKYFESILENVKTFNNFNVYGHLDYVVRYGPNKNKYFDFSNYKDVFEEILKIIIQNGKGIEINTAGLRKNLGYPHPHKDILKMYKELGGEIITIGSDSHFSNHIGYKFDQVKKLLKDIGFKYYTIFDNQKSKFYNI